MSSKKLKYKIDIDCKGEFLGTGISRDVYRYTDIYDTVIKIEIPHNGDVLFQNVKEWLTYQELLYTTDINLLAKCHFISPDGTMLIQEYARNVTEADEPMIKKFKYPNFISDIKRDNLGITNDGRLVIRDYGSIIISKNYKKVKFKEWEY